MKERSNPRIGRGSFRNRTPLLLRSLPSVSSGMPPVAGNQQLAYAKSETRPSSHETAPARPSRALPGQILKAMKSRPSDEITVVIVEDHLMFREQLVRLINEADHLRVCGEADNIRDDPAMRVPYCRRARAFRSHCRCIVNANHTIM